MKKTILFATIFLSAFMALSCQKGDSEVDYGNSFIYIPQAMVSGGINNYYNVPSGGGEDTRNYKLSEDGVDIYLGVMLSGEKPSEGFSVNVLEDREASVLAAANLGATVLPQSVYTIPSSVNVEAGKNATTFYLSIPKVFIEENSGIYVLALKLDAPSSYKLSSNGTSVVVVIDVRNIK